MAHKGPGTAPTYPVSQTSSLRIGILHTRWNAPVVTALLNGALDRLTKAGIPRSNILVQSVPGSYELPYAVQRMYTASQTSSATGGLVSAATDLLGSGGSSTDLPGEGKSGETGGSNGAGGPLDAIIAIGVLVKGSTMHFEYISESVSHGLMRVQLDSGCPIVFGLLTCLTEEQAFTRAGIRDQLGGEKKTEGVSHGESGHNHGEDWGDAAVEMAVKKRAWGEGKYVD